MSRSVRKVDRKISCPTLWASVCLMLIRSLVEKRAGAKPEFGSERSGSMAGGFLVIVKCPLEVLI